MQNRREFIGQAGVLSLGALLSTGMMSWTKKSRPTILLVSGWQDVNIGDIAHTPGLLHVLETFVPEADIILWKKSKGQGNAVKELLERNFPKVRIVYGDAKPADGQIEKDIATAFEKADIMLHGSGPSLVGAENLNLWLKNTEKPFGVFGTTLQNPSAFHVGILKKASFIYTRETLSIDHLKEVGISGDHVRFAPDATFFMNIRDESKAVAFLEANQLEERKFICAIPRLRYTPYHQIRKVNWTAEKIKNVEETNLKHKEEDHAKMREAMIAWVRETGNKVLVCPEMTYEVDIMDELLIDPLPDDVKPHVLKRGYWMPDEAASVYAKAHTVLSFECHSPIIAAAVGTPFFYLRQPEDTIKGQMYYDLNFNDWVFEIEQTQGKQVADTLRKVWSDYPKARKLVSQNMKTVDQIYKDCCKAVKRLV
ncbi:polysaccharide pyruvyl transferase family protein [Marinilongibacter aquaticus]|uniref:polysaccharide pyruvyl transferase family protein n=1 Tax=Marinilongibacter aquaticus TaxID=2975157 RepID=UPI0021BDAFE0|nr:polysaccharide pyruvyl transferase family protein [Marinilongibacter aquaticus]UBM59192.1 polysaccharide pyruvyl transferase family protein [Marinilongibacter aquaticus]